MRTSYLQTTLAMGRQCLEQVGEVAFSGQKEFCDIFPIGISLKDGNFGLVSVQFFMFSDKVVSSGVVGSNPGLNLLCSGPYIFNSPAAIWVLTDEGVNYEGR